jgi:hypothetical protein
MELIKSGKPTLEKAIEVSNQVMGLIKLLAFDLSVCVAMTVGLAGADVEGATGLISGLGQYPDLGGADIRG